MLRDGGACDGDPGSSECGRDPPRIANPLHATPKSSTDEPALDEAEALLRFSPLPPLLLLKYPLHLFRSFYPFLNPLA